MSWLGAQAPIPSQGLTCHCGGEWVAWTLEREPEVEVYPPGALGLTILPSFLRLWCLKDLLLLLPLLGFPRAPSRGGQRTKFSHSCTGALHFSQP